MIQLSQIVEVVCLITYFSYTGWLLICSRSSREIIGITLRKELSYVIDLRLLIKNGVHFGHQTSRWSPKMEPYIWGYKNDIHLIDVSKTAI